ncbi:MAG TPA: carbohydrate ABC transporter permease [Trebonia sp.]|nr:carbohydrate ABC transporter permease [Trebonia sp.]
MAVQATSSGPLAGVVQRSPAQRPRSARARLRRLGPSAVLLIISVALLYPVIDAAVGTFLTQGTGQPTLQYWSQVFHAVPVLGDMGVSLALSIGVVCGVILIATPCGYALAKLRFRGSGVVFALAVACMMIPTESILIPEYINFVRLGMVGTLWGTAAVYVGMGIPFGVFLTANYFRQIPDSLVEAAHVDGAGNVQAFLRVMLPLARPALAIVAVMQFLGVWNDLLTALLFMPQQVQTIGVGLASLPGTHVANTNAMVAGSVLSAIPPVLVYLIFQRHLIGGLTMGAEK